MSLHSITREKFPTFEDMTHAHDTRVLPLIDSKYRGGHATYFSPSALGVRSGCVVTNDLKSFDSALHSPAVDALNDALALP